MPKPLTIMLTAAGAPQTATLIRHLRNNGERPVRIVSLDMNPDVIGRFHADAFHIIPAAGATGYRERILEIVEKEKPDAFLNVSGSDVPHIARMKADIEAVSGVVMCSDAEHIELVNNKYELLTNFADNPDVNTPEFCYPKSLDDFVRLARDMGYPNRDLCFKPHISKGSRGFRILTERFNRRDLLLNHKPTSLYMTIEEFISIFESEPNFPDLLLMEVKEGEEIDAMTIGWNGEALLTTLKSRESNRWGVIDRGAYIDRPPVKKSIEAIIGCIPLKYNISIQFIGGALIEINPRTSTFIYKNDFNEPWIAIKLALGLATPMQVRDMSSKIKMGTRMVRYMDQVFFDEAGNCWS